MDFFGGEQRESAAEIKPHLVAKDAESACSRSVTLLRACFDECSQQRQVLLIRRIGAPIRKGAPQLRRSAALGGLGQGCGYGFDTLNLARNAPGLHLIAENGFFW